MKKFVIYSLVCSLCLSISFLFAGCGTDYTYTQIQTSYNSMVTQYTGTFFDEEGDLSFTYDTDLQTLINNGTEANQLAKFSEDITSGQAIFEPVLRSSFEAVGYYLALEVEASEVPQNTLNSLYNKLSILQDCFKQLNTSKARLEEIASTDSAHIQNWLTNYQNLFYETICASNDFALEYVYAYRDYINYVPSIQDRLLPTVVQLEYMTKLVESADIYTKFMLVDVKNEVISTAQNNCNITLESFLQIKDILEGSVFQGLLTTVYNSAEADMITAYEQINNYNDLYRVNLADAYLAINTYDLEQLRLDSSVNPLTNEQQTCLNKLDEFLDTDCVIVNTLLANLKDKIVVWKDFIDSLI